MDETDFQFLRGSIRMLALQLFTLATQVGSLSAVTRSLATEQPEAVALCEGLEHDLLEVQKIIETLLRKLPPEEPSRERIGGNGH